MNIILASQSPNRQSLLKQATVKFQIFIPDIEEEKYLNEKDEPQNICLKIAQEKALKAYKTYPEDIIIASDQLAYLDRKFYGKSLTPEKACQALSELQGKTHDLITSLYMCYKDRSFSHVSISKMSMRTLSLNQIKKYVSTDKPLHCAGSYHIEAAGVGLFKKIKTDDFNSIIGLPLTALINQLILWEYPYLNQSL